MSFLSFKGKALVQNHHLVVPFHELLPVKSAGTTKTASLHGNVVVQGDNLKALKALLPTYSGKIKCVYIDPPYNTGNEHWAYNDAVNSPMMQDWLGKEVDAEDLTKHDKWCCMMLPRLKLLRELISQDGVIFVSIDDHEVHHLRCLLDEVFGQANFLECIIWKKRNGPPNDKVIGAVHEYVLLYARNAAQTKLFLKPRTDEQLSRYKNLGDHPKGEWAPGDLMANVKGGRYVESLRFPIINPRTKRKHWPGADGNWRFNRERIEELIENDEIWFGSDDQGRPKLKRFLNEVKKGTAYSTLWDSVGFNDQATAEMVSILGDQTTFDTPKPTTLITEILRLATQGDDVVLDAFAGSATTGHATLALNKEDGGRRSFVLIESEAYADSVTAERLRRVCSGYGRGATKTEGLGGEFSFFRLGEPMHSQSLLEGKSLPEFDELARYIFFSATGEEFDPKKVNRKTGFIGRGRESDMYLVYTADAEGMKDLALTRSTAERISKLSDRPKVVFAPSKYLDDQMLSEFRITFCQLPYRIHQPLNA